MSEMCGSCGRVEEDLVEVRRVYLVPDAPDDGAGPTVITDELEWWCASCRATYPHQTA